MCLGFSAAVSQETTYQLTVPSKSLEGAIQMLERESGYRFYYKQNWLDSVYLDHANIEGTTFEEVLDKLLSTATLSYVILGQQVILSDVPFIKELVTDEVPSNGYVFEREYLLNDADKQVLIGDKAAMSPTAVSTIAGFVRNADDKEPIVGALVFVPELDKSAVTDANGFYSLSVPSGPNDVFVRFSGMEQQLIKVMVFSDGELNILMAPETILLEEVAVLANADANINTVRMGVNSLNVETIKNVPNVLGENNIVQVALTLPGVQNAGEGATGLNVRGGKTDQNLILLNNATIYNPFHFFGFFSAFPADVIGTMELYKGSVPATTGGRLSSLLDVKLKKGNKEKITGKAGISPITSRLSVEVPVIKGKTSLVAGGRTTYSDWVLNQVNDPDISNSDPSFYDLVVGIDHEYGVNNSIRASGYYSYDQFKLTSDSLYSYYNFNTSLEIRQLLSADFLFSGVFTTSEYGFDIDFETNPVSGFNYGFRINETAAKASVLYTPDERHEVTVGADWKYYDLQPGSILPASTESMVTTEQIEDERGNEWAFFLSENFKFNEKTTLYGGIRYSLFAALGGRTINFYESGVPRSAASLQSSVPFDQSEVIDTYGGPEFRFSLRYALSNESSIKASYTTMRQYLHALSNNVTISPTDTWKLTDPNVAPQASRQVSLGLFRNFEGNVYETSVEAYYKSFDNLLDYKVGAELVLNTQLEREVLQGTGRAYGVELFVRKNSGRLNGWFSYAYSRSQQQFDSVFPEERINGGSYFPSNHEKPHDVSVIANYKYTRRFSLSLNAIFSSGRPVTYPTAKYTLGGNEVVHFSDRNQFRIPNYFRIDLSANIEGSHKLDRPIYTYWTLSLYNLTARRNVYSVFFQNDGGTIQAYELSVLGTIIPSITYNIKF